MTLKPICCARQAISASGSACSNGSPPRKVIPSISCFSLLSKICFQMSSTDTFDPLFGFHVHGTPHPLQCIGQPCTQTHALFPGPSAFVIGKNRCNWINIPSLPFYLICALQIKNRYGVQVTLFLVDFSVFSFRLFVYVMALLLHL